MPQRMTREDILAIKEIHEKYPELPNALIAKMLEPKRTESTVAKVLAGDYDSLLGEAMGETGEKPDLSVVNYQVNKANCHLTTIEQRLSQVTEEQRMLRNQLHAMQDELSAQIEELCDVLAALTTVTAMHAQTYIETMTPKFTTQTSQLALRKQKCDATIKEMNGYGNQ